MLLLLGVLFALLVCIGALLSYSQQSQITALSNDIKALKKQLATQDFSGLKRSDSQAHIDNAGDKHSSENKHPSFEQPNGSEQQVALDTEDVESEKSSRVPLLQRFLSDESSLMTSIKRHGLLWLGGVVLAVGGVFLAVYSVEAGLLSAEIRVLIGAAFGIALVAGAEYLARHREKFSIYSPTICAALASGGVITCYAIILVAYDFYQFIAPVVAFLLMAVVAFGAISLALRYGPLLASIGIVGAYAIPALIKTDADSIVTLLVFISLVSLSGVWISQKVSQMWLWRLSILGHFTWAFMALTQSDKADIVVWLGFTVFSVYLFCFTHTLGWSLRDKFNGPLSLKELIKPSREMVGVLLSFILLHAYLVFYAEDMHIWLSAAVLGALLLLPSYRHSIFDSWPFLLLVAAVGHVVMLEDMFIIEAITGRASGNAGRITDINTVFSGVYLYVQIAALAITSYVALMAHKTQRPAFWIYIVAFPITLFGVSYALTATFAQQLVYSVWAFELALLAILSTWVIFKSQKLAQLTYAVLANACLTLCLTMLLDAAVLSFALALQVASISVLSLRYKVSLPDWLYKVLLAIVMVRITVAPWLADYAYESILGVHWTAVIYPFIFLSLLIARKYNPSDSLKVWLEGALLHLIALFITTEPGYYLTGNYPSVFSATYQESVLLALGWVALSGAYYYRAYIASTMTVLYRNAALVLLIGAGIIHTDISIKHNPFIYAQPTGDGAVFNWLLLQWLLPAALIGCILSSVLQRRVLGSLNALSSLMSQQLRIGLGAIAGGFAFLYVNSVIRGAFHQASIILDTGFTQPELYTYSICWLVIATTTIFIGQIKQRVLAVKLGFGLLAVVILKAFVIDMANLEGLYRALSFIGLGLSLVGIGWLFQKLRGDAELSGA